MKCLPFLICGSILLVSCHFTNKSALKSTTSVVLDAEMDLDDLCAAYLLARNYKENLACITISGTEHYYFEHAPESVAKILTLAERETIPVSAALSTSFCEASMLPDVWKTLNEAPLAPELPAAAFSPFNITAPELLLKISETNTNKLIILCLGPLNNIAHIIIEHPPLREKIERIVLLGGALHVSENITAPLTSKWKEASNYNFFLDPCAANIVFTSHIPITLIPFDITSLIPINDVIIGKYAPTPQSEGAKFVLDVIKNASQGPLPLTRVSPFWDMVAAAAIFDPSIVTLEKISLRVITDPGEHFGDIVQDEDGTLVDVCTYIDSDKFYSYFFGLINR